MFARFLHCEVTFSAILFSSLELSELRTELKIKLHLLAEELNGKRGLPTYGGFLLA